MKNKYFYAIVVGIGYNIGAIIVSYFGAPKDK